MRDDEPRPVWMSPPITHKEWVVRGYVGIHRADFFCLGYTLLKSFCLGVNKFKSPENGQTVQFVW